VVMRCIQCRCSIEKETYFRGKRDLLRSVVMHCIQFNATTTEHYPETPQMPCM